MFGMGMTEILLVLALALIVIGPKKLPGLARTLGRGLAEFRRATDDLQRTINQEVHKPLDAKQFLKEMGTIDAQVEPGPPPGERKPETAQQQTEDTGAAETPNSTNAPA